MKAPPVQQSTSAVGRSLVAHCLTGHGRVPTSFVGQRRPALQRMIGAMQLTLTGKQIEIGEALRRHIEGSLGSILE